MKKSFQTGVMYKQGNYEGAVRDILHILEPGLCESHDVCEGCKYEWNEAVEIAKSVLGQPIDRQKCLHCGELDTIFWHIDDPHPRETMSCHNCGHIAESKGKDYEWVKEPADE